MTTRYLICGGREFADYAMMEKVLDVLILHPEHAVIIQGDARGADKLAAQWGMDRKVAEIITDPADWVGQGRGAGVIRNTRMLKVHKPDVVIAFPGGRGTADMVRKARAAGVVVVGVTV